MLTWIDASGVMSLLSLALEGEEGYRMALKSYRKQ